MRHIFRLIFVGLGCVLVWQDAAAAAEADARGARSVEVVQVDVLDRLYPDRAARPARYTQPISVARGSAVAFQLAVTASRDVSCGLSVAGVEGPDGGSFTGRVRVYELLPVHVEGNTQGSLKNRPGGKVPAGWVKTLVRLAPFDVMEVLVESDRLNLSGGRTHAILVDIEVPPDTAPGRYTARLRLDWPEATREVGLRLLVHKTVLPASFPLHCVHWFWPAPENLTNGPQPAWWSPRHWELIENSGRQLRRFGDDTMFTPLLGQRDALIRTLRKEDGSIEFDYSRFDRWVETFLRVGFEYFSGHHIRNQWREAVVLDRSSGKLEPLVAGEDRQAQWLEFIPTFYKSLHAHLRRKGWTDRYLQHQYDEPKDEKAYRRLAELAREHMPGVRTIDAVNSRPGVFSPLVDVHVFNLLTLKAQRELARKRAAEGRPVWLYHCTSPYPPYPNRHLDRPLSECRLWPWICYRFSAEGFLYWAANLYRGADEYKTSIGPFPNGSQDPGHPPGDAWFYYRGADGLRPSMRILAFREGLADHALLTMLGRKDGALAERLVGQIVGKVTDYRTEPAAYHAARKTALVVLDTD